MIKYVGNDIIHIYKGYEIKKVEKYYSQGREVYYTTISSSEPFYTLRDAKKYIDKKVERGVF